MSAGTVPPVRLHSTSQRGPAGGISVAVSRPRRRRGRTRLAMPIDHTLIGPSAGVVRSWDVLTSQDVSGARHRPTLTVVDGS